MPRQIPEPEYAFRTRFGTVGAPSREAAVGRNRNPTRPSDGPPLDRHLPSQREIPQPEDTVVQSAFAEPAHRPFDTASCQAAAVRGERQTSHPAPPEPEDSHVASSPHIPQPNGVLAGQLYVFPTGRGQEMSIRRERD